MMVLGKILDCRRKGPVPYTFGWFACGGVGRVGGEGVGGGLKCKNRVGGGSVVGVCGVRYGTVDALAAVDEMVQMDLAPGMEVETVERDPGSEDAPGAGVDIVELEVWKEGSTAE